MHFWSFWAKYCHFLHILSNAQPKTNVNQVPRWVFCYVGCKTFDFSSRNQYFLPQNDQIWPKIGIFGRFGPGHAGLFSALLVSRLVVVARGLYLARHLFTLSHHCKVQKNRNIFLCNTTQQYFQNALNFKIKHYLCLFLPKFIIMIMPPHCF